MKIDYYEVGTIERIIVQISIVKYNIILRYEKLKTQNILITYSKY